MNPNFLEFELFLLCRNNEERDLRDLIENHKEINLEINDKSDEGHTPLIASVLSGNKNSVLLLLEKGVNIENRNFFNCTALYKACQSDNYEIVKILIDHGADPNSLNTEGFTPLTWAAANGNEKIIDLLLENGADIDGKPGVSTPLICSSVNYKNKTVKYLIKLGANPYIEDNEAHTLFSTYSGNKDKLLKLIESFSSFVKPAKR